MPNQFFDCSDKICCKLNKASNRQNFKLLNMIHHHLQSNQHFIGIHLQKHLIITLFSLKKRSFDITRSHTLGIQSWRSKKCRLKHNKKNKQNKCLYFLQKFSRTIYINDPLFKIPSLQYNRKIKRIFMERLTWFYCQNRHNFLWWILALSLYKWTSDILTLLWSICPKIRAKSFPTRTSKTNSKVSSMRTIKTPKCTKPSIISKIDDTSSISGKIFFISKILKIQLKNPRSSNSGIEISSKNMSKNLWTINTISEASKHWKSTLWTIVLPMRLFWSIRKNKATKR